MTNGLVILTGAGISAESGLATFRGADGLWCGHRVQDVATPEAFARNPLLVHDFYNMRRAQLREVRPNRAHEALARLEREWDGDFLLVTQNVDDLHERAGSEKLLHMHGELRKGRCEACDAVFAWHGDMGVDDLCPDCGAAGGVRPHIVWFGEIPLEMERIYRALARCDLFVAVGTSGQVYPAAGFVHQAAMAGARTLAFNLDPSGVFDEERLGPAGERLPEWVEQMLA